MPDLYTTRAPRDADVPFLAAIAGDTLFPAEMMPDMIAPFLARQSDDLWRVVTTDDDTPVGFAFAQPEAMTMGTWNLRAIATAPDIQGTGAGTALLGAVETALSDARLLVIDTTQMQDQARARRFYAARGCVQVATIPGFFSPEEDKVTFIKPLS